MKVYEIFLNDIWNNCYLLGFYNNLDDAIDDINKNIVDEKFHLSKGDLKEYPSTFGYTFDTCVGDIYLNKHPESNNDFYSDDENLWVRGFILDSQNLLNTLSELNNE